MILTYRLKKKLLFYNNFIVSKNYIYSYSGTFLLMLKINEVNPLLAKFSLEIIDLIIFNDKKEKEQLISAFKNNDSIYEIKLLTIEKNNIKIKYIFNFDPKDYCHSFYIYKLNNTKILLYKETKNIFFILNIHTCQIETKLKMNFNISKFYFSFLFMGNFIDTFHAENNKNVHFTNISKSKKKIIDKNLIKNIFPKKDLVVSSSFGLIKGIIEIKLRVLNKNLFLEIIKIKAIFPENIAYNIYYDSIYKYCTSIENGFFYFVFSTMDYEFYIAKCKVDNHEDNRVMCYCYKKGETEQYDIDNFVLKDNKIYYFKRNNDKVEQVKIITDDMFL